MEKKNFKERRGMDLRGIGRHYGPLPSFLFLLGREGAIDATTLVNLKRLV